jgi:hypothetical protein
VDFSILASENGLHLPAAQRRPIIAPSLSTPGERMTTPDEPLTLPDRDSARRMWDVLEQARFTTALPLQLADIDETDVGSGPRDPRRVAIGLRRTACGGVLEALTRLFLIGTAVPAEEARRAVAPTSLDLWTGAGLLEQSAGQVRARMQLAPVQGKLLAADPRLPGAVRPDHVMGYCGSTATLTRLTMRRRVGSLLDLGTGCGIHAILGAAHADRVVGTDLNSRAVNVTAFNARLNGLDNVEVLEGDLFAPVRGRRFDLIVANPPFIISPETGLLYRDGGRPGDALLEEVLREVPRFLNEGGYCEMLCEWAHLRGQDWRDRLAGWARGNGCDVWVLQANTYPAQAHAEKWAGGDEAESAEQWAARMDRWLAYYEQIGIEAISNGVLLLRRRSGPNWFFIDRAPNIGGDVGKSVELGFALRDWLATHPDEALLRARLSLSPEVRWQQTLAPAEEGWTMSEATASIHEGLQFQMPRSRYAVGLLDRCRGGASVAEAVAALDAATSQEVDRVSALAVVRELVAQGFLLPAG